MTEAEHIIAVAAIDATLIASGVALAAALLCGAIVIVGGPVFRARRAPEPYEWTEFSTNEDGE